MGQLAASIAHELNQPLASMLYNARAGVQLVSTANVSMPELREIFEDIATDNLRARDVIVRVRELVSKRAPQRAPVNMNELVQTVKGLVGNDAAALRVSIDLDLAPMALLVNGDQLQLQQVVLNILMNALEAAASVEGSQGKVTLKTALGKHQAVHVMVVDTGPGLPPGDEKQIFESFYTTKPSGMGMGLSIARSIIESHGGTIWVERPTAGGALFQFTIPHLRAMTGFDASLTD
jgi:signal transduction histidine kinase